MLSITSKNCGTAIISCIDTAMSYITHCSSTDIHRLIQLIVSTGLNSYKDGYVCWWVNYYLISGGDNGLVTSFNVAGINDASATYHC